MELSGKKVTVVGLGKSGVAASRLLVAKGAKVSATDAQEDDSLRRSAQSLKREGISVELGKHTKRWIEGRDLIVTSPGVPPTSLPLQWAREEKIPVMSEIELGSFFCKGKVIAITGSNGKSTTVTLLGKILEEGGEKAFVCGNIGEPFCKVVPKVKEKDWVILEVSSFQLEQCYTFRPKVAIFLNLSPNHLDRHPSFEAYLLAKRRITRSQTENDFLLLNADNPFTRSLGKGLLAQKYYFSRREKVQGVFLRGKEVLSSLPASGIQKIATLEKMKLRGPHNEENALSAVLAALLVGIEPAAIQKVLETFEGLPHRIEFVGQTRGVCFFNDSKSTTVSSTLHALETLPGPLLLIAGGREKNESFSTFANSPLLKKVKRVYLIGEAKEKIQKSLGGKVTSHLVPTLEEAVSRAYQDACAGETIILSPMCTSFDMFKDFEERGDRFKESVAALLSEKKVPLEEEVRAH